MARKDHKFQIDEEVLHRYRVLCAELNLTMGKQTEYLIDSFVNIQRENVKIMKKLKRMGK